MIIEENNNNKQQEHDRIYYNFLLFSFSILARQAVYQDFAFAIHTLRKGKGNVIQKKETEYLLLFRQSARNDKKKEHNVM